MPIPIDGPDGPADVKCSFTWAKVFMKRMERALGKDFLARRLRSWSWCMGTAFSGVGCAELVISLLTHVSISGACACVPFVHDSLE